MNMDHVRQFVDGELSAQESAKLEAALVNDSSLRDAVAFERSLRKCISREMSDTASAAPVALRQSVREVMAGAAHTIPISECESTSLSRIFAAPARANMLAVAACLLIVAGAVIVGIFGDDWGLGMRGPANSASSGVRVDVLAGTAQQAGLEHGRCMGNASALATKMHYHDREAIQRNMAGRLGVNVPVFDLSLAGLDLIGGGECSLGPLAQSTVHLMYRDRRGRGGLSVFMQPNRGQFGEMEIFAQTAKIYTPSDINACSGEPTCLFTDGRIVYIVRACDPAVQEAAMAGILQVLMGRN